MWNVDRGLDWIPGPRFLLGGSWNAWMRGMWNVDWIGYQDLDFCSVVCGMRGCVDAWNVDRIVLDWMQDLLLHFGRISRFQ